MARLDETAAELMAALADRYGGSSGSPAGLTGHEHVSLFERLAWVALNQVVAPKVAAAAFDALDAAGLLDPACLGSANPLELDDIMKRSRVAVAIKSLRPLQKLGRWAADLGGPVTVVDLAAISTEAIRDEWRAVNGIGMATADTLLLLGLGRPSYPVDRATYRILVRHGWIDPTAEYDEARQVVERLGRFRTTDPEQSHGGGLDDEATVEALSNLGRWFDRVGREFCKPALVHCEHCPLRPWLPEAGPVEVE